MLKATRTEKGREKRIREIKRMVRREEKAV
jgi:hypothetical protein